jgi:hypothetical protein
VRFGGSGEALLGLVVVGALLLFDAPQENG